MHIYWSPFFTGWLIKTVMLRYGGLKYYRSALPVFIGLIVGDILHQGIASVVGWIIAI